MADVNAEIILQDVKFCAFCLSTSECNNVTESSVLTNSNRKDLLQKIFKSISLQSFEESEVCFTRICSTCDTKLEFVTSFLEECIRSQSTLTSQIKVEYAETLWDAGGFELENELPILVTVKENDVEENEWDTPLSELQLNSSNNILRCDVCSKSYKSAARLANHRATLHNNDPLKCVLCSETFITISKLKRHESEQHKSILKETCRICRRKFEHKLGLLLHKKECHNVQQGDHEVAECLTKNKEQDGELEEETHRGYCCNFCKALFPSLKVCRNHITEIHINEKLRYKGTKVEICFCGKTFRRKCLLRLHKMKAHDIKSNTSKLLTCPECGNVFSSKKTLEYHRNKHLGQKPYLCSYCPAAFFSPGGLLMHEKIRHQGISRYKVTCKFLCNFCGRDFARKSGLKRHMIIHMQVERKHHCSFPGCSKSFVSKERLTGHSKIHTATFKYFCDECKKGFKNKNRCQQHKNRVHLNLRPFVCGTCQRAFKVKNHLINHMRTHTGEKPFMCPECPYSCTEQSNLKKHLKMHNRNSSCT